MLSGGVAQLISGALNLFAIAAIMLWLNLLLAPGDAAHDAGDDHLLTWLQHVRRTRTARSALQQSTPGAFNWPHRGDDLGATCAARKRTLIARTAVIARLLTRANRSFRRTATQARIFAPASWGRLPTSVNNAGLRPSWAAWAAGM